jgi:serine/threonine-protein kinase
LRSYLSHRKLQWLLSGSSEIRRDLITLVNDQLGEEYTIEREIARGGAARVFLAHTADGQKIALKVLNPQLAVTVTGKRFVREVDFLRRIEHANIARFLDFGETDLLIYYVMDYIEGPTLREHLARVHTVSIDDTVQIASDLLDALSYAHAQGIVHRDVKPENIILSRRGPVLVDFGIARAIQMAGMDRLTRSGFVVGTSGYMSPEQIQGAADIDHRSDLYSLGCVLYECLSGRPPFYASREQTVLRMHLEEAPPNVRDHREDVPRGLATAIRKAVVRDRGDRWPDAMQMKEALSKT